jgi:hypothetical protein
MFASLICKKFFEVNALTVCGFCEETMTLIGTEHHLQIARYVLDFLTGEFRRTWNRKKGRCKKRKDFLWGCYVALDQKLSERFGSRGGATTAVEVSWKAKRDAYMQETFGETKATDVRKKAKPSAAARQGFINGREIEIRPGVDGKEAPRRGQVGQPTTLLLGEGR